MQLFPAAVDPQRQEFFAPTVETDTEGGYRMSKLPPGRYVVGVNLLDEPTDAMPFSATFYREPGSNEPSIIELGYGTHTKLEKLRLPSPLEKRQITGTIAWNDGRVPTDVSIVVCDDRAGRWREYCRSFAMRTDGGFSAAMFAGRTYKIKATAADPRGRWNRATDQPIPPIGVAEVAVRLDGDYDALRLILVPRRERP